MYPPFPPPHIATSRLLLRPLTCFDFPALHAIMRKPEVMYAWGHGFTPAETYSWLLLQLKRYREDGYGYFAVILKESGTLIGQVGLFKNEIKEREVVELSYIFDNLYWHVGYCTESASACLEYAFSTLNLTELYCFIRPCNQPSIRVAERLGMERIGEHIKTYQGVELLHEVYRSIQACPSPSSLRSESRRSRSLRSHPPPKAQ